MSKGLAELTGLDPCWHTSCMLVPVSIRSCHKGTRKRSADVRSGERRGRMKERESLNGGRKGHVALKIAKTADRVDSSPWPFVPTALFAEKSPLLDGVISDSPLRSYPILAYLLGLWWWATRTNDFPGQEHRSNHFSLLPVFSLSVCLNFLRE